MAGLVPAICVCSVSASSKTRMPAHAGHDGRSCDATLRLGARGLRCCIAVVRPRPRLSQPADPRAGAVRGRRRGRHAGAPGRPASSPNGSASRSSSRTGRAPAAISASDVRRQVAARRLHRAADRQRHRHQPVALQDAAVRPAQGLHRRSPSSSHRNFCWWPAPSSTPTSSQDLIALAKAKPGTLNYGSTGVGNPLHLTMEMLKSAAGIDIQAGDLSRRRAGSTPR